jgi:hypothetical protein
MKKLKILLKNFERSFISSLKVSHENWERFFVLSRNAPWGIPECILQAKTHHETAIKFPQNLSRFSVDHSGTSQKFGVIFRSGKERFILERRNV